MQPVPIPEAVAAARPWARLLSFGPPPGVSDDECGTCPAMMEHLPGETFPSRVRIALQVSDEELGELVAGAPVWLTLYCDGLVPFSLQTALPEPVPPSTAVDPLGRLEVSQRRIVERASE